MKNDVLAALLLLLGAHLASAQSLIRFESIGTYDQARRRSIVTDEVNWFLASSTTNSTPFAGKFGEPAPSLKLYKIYYKGARMGRPVDKCHRNRDNPRRGWSTDFANALVYA